MTTDSPPSPALPEASADAAADAVVAELARQDHARDTASGYRGQVDAPTAIRRWRATAADAGDAATVEAIDRIGKKRAAEVYAAARTPLPEAILRWEVAAPGAIGWVLRYDAAGGMRHASVEGDYDDAPGVLAAALGWLGLELTGRVNVYRDGDTPRGWVELRAGKPTGWGPA